MKTLRLPAAVTALLLASTAAWSQQPAPAPAAAADEKPRGLRFAVIGDTGTASKQQFEVGRQMALAHAKRPFEFAIMVGDNIYGSGGARDYAEKFEAPYKGLLDAGLKFYASLGNHDDGEQKSYKNFNMGGERFYTFRGSPGGLGKLAGGGVRFFALDSNYMDKTQLDWLEKELAQSGSDWKIAFFHHPLYSSARKHGSQIDLRKVLEPLFVRYGVDVVFAGHDHVYERIKPQQGITHFVSGSGGALRKGDLRRAAFTAAGYDQDYHFMAVEIVGDEMHFEAITRTGKVVDSGTIRRE